MSNFVTSDLVHWAQQKERHWAANCVTNLDVKPDIRSWSWQAIYSTYKFYGQQLNSYKDIADRFELDLPLKVKPGELIIHKNGSQQFISLFYAGVNRIDNQLKVLDREIARRNTLIGVM